MKNLFLFLTIMIVSSIAFGQENKKTVTDIDGNVYKTVTIGTQVWMASNLKTTKYNDGKNIPNVTVDGTWETLTTGAYCWYNNDEATYKATYGALYNWYAVNTGKLCPVGWHLPTDAEWTKLITYLGGKSVAGGKLKETGAIHWYIPNTEATNSSGFTALPGGYRYDNEAFDGVGYYGTWWCSTELNTNTAWGWSMGYGGSSAGRSIYNKASGFSVRCLRDI